MNLPELPLKAINFSTSKRSYAVIGIVCIAQYFTPSVLTSNALLDLISPI